MVCLAFVLSVNLIPPPPILALSAPGDALPCTAWLFLHWPQPALALPSMNRLKP